MVSKTIARHAKKKKENWKTKKVIGLRKGTLKKIFFLLILMYCSVLGFYS